jgi:hypothetical protein
MGPFAQLKQVVQACDITAMPSQLSEVPKRPGGLADIDDALTCARSSMQVNFVRGKSAVAAAWL